MAVFTRHATVSLVLVTALSLAVAAAGERAERSDEPRFPDFARGTLDGDRVSLEDYAGQRVVVFVFRPGVERAGAVARAVARVAPLRLRHNFEVVGVAVGDPAAAREFAKRHDLRFPVLLDPAGALARGIRLRTPLALLVLDGERRLLAALGRFPRGPEQTSAGAEAQLREVLRLPAAQAASPDVEHEPDLLSRAPAPDFEARRIEGGSSLVLSSLRGRPVVLIFFLYNCPYCHGALTTLREVLSEMDEERRPEVVGVEISGHWSRARATLAEMGLDDFHVVVDPEWSLRSAYAVLGQVPVLFLIDAEGRILYRTSAGWDHERDPRVLRSWLAKLAGVPVPMLLDPTGYTGSQVCGACHERELATWQLTSHAQAFDTLVAHASDRNPECVGCHVVGFGEPGGYELGAARGATSHALENVGCEACHGRGGPHLSPQSRAGGSLESACVTCHDAKHSLGFDYATFRPRISHARLAALSPDERAALLGSAAASRNPLPEGGELVGSDACRSCHPAEFGTWSASAHARAVVSLAREQKAHDATCLRCHTTGFGRPGGFPTEATADAPPDLARVGCESCHGPGGAHVAEGARKLGSIVSLGDKCDSCVILQICGSCHDEANDPRFTFEVQERIERQRHGTIEPGTGRPKDTADAAR